MEEHAPLTTVAFTVLTVGMFLTRLLVAPSSSPVVLGWASGWRGDSSASQVLRGEGYRHPHPQQPVQGWDGDPSTDRSPCKAESAGRGRELCHRGYVEGSQAGNETTAFLSSLLSTSMEGSAAFQCQLHRSGALCALDGLSFIRGGHEGTLGWPDNRRCGCL